MGGRGRSSGKGARQYSLDGEILRSRITSIVLESAKSRATIAGNGSGGINPITSFKKCACCGEYTIPSGTVYQICPVCGWVDDSYQNKNPEAMDGKNTRSLKQAREEHMKNTRRK